MAMKNAAKPGPKPTIGRVSSRAFGRNMGVLGPKGLKGKLPMRKVKP